MPPQCVLYRSLPDEYKQRKKKAVEQSTEELHHNGVDEAKNSPEQRSMTVNTECYEEASATSTIHSRLLQSRRHLEDNMDWIPS